VRLFFFSLLFACSPKWSSVADCEKETEVSLADSCYGEVLPDLFRTDPNGADQLVQARIQDPMVRDFVYLTVTREIDPSTYRWCERMQEKVLIERCRVIVGRPHLHEALKIEANGGTVQDMTDSIVGGNNKRQNAGSDVPDTTQQDQGRQGNSQPGKGNSQPVRNAPPRPQ